METVQMETGTAWELRNRTLKEVYLGWSPMGADDLRDRHKESRPAEIVHWDPEGHDIEYVSVAGGLNWKDALDFLLSYSKAMADGEWKILHSPKWEFF